MLQYILSLSYLFFNYPLPTFSQASKWPTLISHDPQAKQLLLYCNTISLTQPECTTKFLTPSYDANTFPPNFVSFRAAATCVSQASLTSTRLQQMFNVDPSTLSLLASSSSSSTTTPNLNWQEMSDSSYWRATYSVEAREAAGKAARDAYAEHMHGIRQAEQIPSWVTPMMDGHDKMAEKAFDLGKMLLDASQTYWGVGEDKYRAAYNSPWTVGVQPDLVCAADSAGCLSRDEGGGVSSVPSPEGEGSNILEGPSGEGEKNEEDPTEKNEWPEGMDEDPDLTEPIINDDEEVDLEDEIEATPVLKDEITKTAMEECQEKEEKKLWDEIGSTTFDPDAESNNAQSEEERRAQAEHYKRLGFCDKTYYGEDGCREWKRKLDSVPLTPDAKLELETQLQGRLELCPVNLVKLTDCQRAKQSVYMRFAILDETMQNLDNKFQPGRPVDVVPRLDFLSPGQNFNGSTEGYQVRPLEEKKGSTVTDDLPFKPVSIPRLPEHTVPKPYTPPSGEVPRLPFSSSPPSIPPGNTGSDNPRPLMWEMPGTGAPKTPGIPKHQMPQDQVLNRPAIGGHTTSPFRLPPQG
ncbi:MAG: hypothetical protein Q9178_004750 [Gyalolechia marmorata]